MDNSSDGKEPTYVDKAAAQAFGGLADRMSRRGLLAKSAKLLMTAVGVGASVQLLPRFAEIAQASTNGTCNDWYMCGAFMYKCNNCVACSGNTNDDLFHCPDCSRVGESWDRCCRMDQNTSKLIQYVDCFKGDCNDTRFQNCLDCRGAFKDCSQNQHNKYGGTSTYYMCTKVVIGDNC